MRGRPMRGPPVYIWDNQLGYYSHFLSQSGIFHSKGKLWILQPSLAYMASAAVR